MARLLNARKPSRRELRRLVQILEEPGEGRCQQRAEVLVLYAAGLNGLDMAQAAGVHPNTVYAYLRGFAERGIAFVEACPRRGLPASLTAAQMEEMARIADQSPTELGLPYGHWSLSKLRDYLVQERHFFKTISLEHLRRLLKKKGSTFAMFSGRSAATTRKGWRSWPVSARLGAACLPAG
jgi:transposase